jgi:Spx/MgsR family transcriptional regulator
MSSKPPVHLHVYGIGNCDSCRAALKWLHARSVPHTFHDLRADGLSPGVLESWLASPHAAVLINRRSKTWRQLSAEDKQAAADRPLELLLSHPTLIKRPVITDGANLLEVGFDPARLEGCI